MTEIPEFKTEVIVHKIPGDPMDKYGLSVYIYGELAGIHNLGVVNHNSLILANVDYYIALFRRVLKKPLEEMPLLINDSSNVIAGIAKIRLKHGK